VEAQKKRETREGEEEEESENEAAFQSAPSAHSNIQNWHWRVLAVNK